MIIGAYKPRDISAESAADKDGKFYAAIDRPLLTS
jgi:hypothetical protein